MDERPTLEAVLEGINAFLCRHGERRFDAACKAPEASVDHRLAALVHVLDQGRWVILLDSFEAVAADAPVRSFVERLQSDLHGSALLLGTRAMPEWGDAGAEVPVREIGQAAGFTMLAGQGIEERHRKALYDKVGGLPGALVRIAMLVRSRGVAAATRDLSGTAADVGDRLLAETFDALSEGAQRLWTGICLLPAPLTREAARQMCARDDFDASWDELAHWKLLQMTEDRAELHPLARSAGEKRLEGMAAWRRACGQRIARYYADFAERNAEDREAIEAELENLMRGAELGVCFGQCEVASAIARASGRSLYYWGMWGPWTRLMETWHSAALSGGDMSEVSESARYLGSARQARGAITAAKEAYEESRRAAQASRDARLQSKSLHSLGTLWWGDPSKHDEALDLLLKALELARQVDDKWEEASILHDLGALQAQRGELDDAEDRLAASQRLRERIGETHLAMYSEVARANVALKRGRREEAKSTYLRCLQRTLALPDKHLEAMLHHQMGNVALDAEDFAAAARSYETARSMHEALGDLDGEAKAAYQMAIVARRQKDWSQARALLESTRYLSKSLGERKLLCEATWQLAVIAVEQGEYAVAEPLLEEFLSLSEGNEDRPRRGCAWWALGEIAEGRDEKGAALDRLRAAQELFRAMGATALKLDERLARLERETRQGGPQAPTGGMAAEPAPSGSADGEGRSDAQEDGASGGAAAEGRPRPPVQAAGGEGSAGS
jgi:hypothetical protein